MKIKLVDFLSKYQSWPPKSKIISYDAKMPWPEPVEIEIDNGNKCKLYSLEATVLAPNNVNIGERPDIRVQGSGETFEEAEAEAWEEYQKYAKCDQHAWKSHVFSKKHGVFWKQVQLEGFVSCDKCGLICCNLFMEDKLRRARNLAIKYHAGQFRKYHLPDEDPIPYIHHPIDVYSYLLWTDFPREKWVTISCAAYLHDTLEDTNITEQEILDATDADVLRLVKELTNPSKGSKASRAERKQMDRDHLSHVSQDAKIIKLVDRICNLKDIEICPDKKFIALYANESQLLLDCLKGTDQELEQKLQERIEKARKLV